MASFDYRLNPLYAIKECSSCGALYTADFCCSKGGLEDKILVPKPTQNCATYGDPIDGLYCRSYPFCAKVKKKSELRKSKRLKIDIGRFPFATMMTRSIPLLSHPDLPTKEPVDSLSMGDEHLSTILEKELDELIKSSVENLVPIPSDDDESFSDEDIPKEIYSNPLFDEEIIFDKIDASISSSPKIDSLPEQFSGKLAHIDLIPPGINEDNLDPEGDIYLVERSLYDNSSPRPPEELNST
ncbi:hypothetical protein Tco_1219503 [Tanacetum coccineum]